MISGLVLKYLNGEYFVIRRGYETARPVSSSFCLTVPAGLLRSDFIEQDGILSVNIRPHPWRSLKTANSTRLIPLVGSAKWAAERILEKPDGSEFAFPNYNDGERTNANSASAALNKWLKTKIGQEYTIHSFRHSMRDRLRAVECPSDVIDQIGGWLTQGVGNSYGEGYPVNILVKQMAKACINI